MLVPRFYEDLNVMHDKTMPARTYYIPASVRMNDLVEHRERSDRFQLLNGEWKFQYYNSIYDVTESFYEKGYDVSGFDQVTVPGVWQMDGYDTHQYTNIRYPFPFDPPYVPQDIPCGAYVHNFEYHREEKMSTKIRNILFALIFICCVSIAGNIIQGFYLPGQAVASSKSEELDIEALQKVWSEKLQAEFDEKLRKSEQEQKRTIDSLSQIITNNPGKAKEYMEVIINQYDIIERLDDIINNLQELRDVSEGKEKEQKLKETVAMVQKLEPELKKKYGISENEFNGKEKNGREYGILLLLKQNIAKENSSRAQSHYDSIINRVKEIRDKIK